MKSAQKEQLRTKEERKANNLHEDKADIGYLRRGGLNFAGRGTPGGARPRRSRTGPTRPATSNNKSVAPTSKAPLASGQ
eukprot:scaffold310551_cov35-Prasinocladus_malaysianus.AAC.1